MPVCASTGGSIEVVLRASVAAHPLKLAWRAFAPFGGRAPWREPRWAVELAAPVAVVFPRPAAAVLQRACPRAAHARDSAFPRVVRDLASVSGTVPRHPCARSVPCAFSCGHRLPTDRLNGGVGEGGGREVELRIHPRPSPFLTPHLVITGSQNSCVYMCLFIMVRVAWPYMRIRI